MAESFDRSAMWAVPTETDAPPTALESLTRTRLPPRLLRTIIRTVWLLIPASVGGIGKRRAGVPGGGGGGGGGPGTMPVTGPEADAPRPPAAPPVTASCCAVAHVATQCSAVAAPARVHDRKNNAMFFTDMFPYSCGSGWNNENTAPCGSANTDIRPTLSIVIGPM